MCIEILLEEQKKKQAKGEQKAEEKAKEEQPQAIQDSPPGKRDDEKDGKKDPTQVPSHEEVENQMQKEKTKERFQIVMRPETLEKWKAEDHAVHKVELSTKGVYKITASKKEIPIEESKGSKDDFSRKDDNDEGMVAKTKTLTDQRNENMEDEKEKKEGAEEQEDRRLLYSFHFESYSLALWK